MSKDSVIELTRRLIAAPPCCAELKAAAKSWLGALGTAGEGAAAAGFIAELKEDIAPIDGVIAFMRSEEAAAIFGAELAAEKAAHYERSKAAGAKLCDCPACGAAAAILENQAELL